MKITSIAPMRIDLAGGTLDIYPLYVLENGGLTLNAAITLTSEVSIESGGDGIRIISEDLGEEIFAPSADMIDPAAGLDLLARIVRFYKPEPGIVIRTKNNVPKGSGLGASSSLLIALSHALNELNGNKYSAEQLIEFGANIEAQTIRIPTGKQDYYSATYGGFSTIWFDVDGIRREPLIDSEELVAELEKRIVVSFAGKPRFSGASNWAMTRAYIDGEETTVRNIGRIKANALEMRSALAAGDLDKFADFLNKEWDNRKQLADGVTNNQLDAIVQAASDAGALASKICGAGGGGCMLTLCAPGTNDAVKTALTNAGAKVLNCGISREGVRVTKE